MLVEMAHQRLERTCPNLCVRVQEQDVSSIGRFQGAVVGMGEATVHTRNHACLRELFCHKFGSSVRGAIVGDDHVERTRTAMFEDAGDAGS